MAPKGHFSAFASSSVCTMGYSVQYIETQGFSKNRHSPYSMNLSTITTMPTPLKSRTKQCISCGDLDDLVVRVYGRPYSFQQQNGCKNRGDEEHVRVPTKNPEDYKKSSIPDVINGDEMGVSFAAWLARDPTEWNGDKNKRFLDLFWARNFYPHVEMVLNDLHAKGLVKAGDYVIEIDW